jgi:hypothetical protein
MQTAADNQPKPVKHFQRYTSEQRADLMASHRLGRHQRESIGEVFWTTELAPGIAFPTRKAALNAARPTP